MVILIHLNKSSEEEKNRSESRIVWIESRLFCFIAELYSYKSAVLICTTSTHASADDCGVFFLAPRGELSIGGWLSQTSLFLLLILSLVTHCIGNMGKNLQMCLLIFFWKYRNCIENLKQKWTIGGYRDRTVSVNWSYTSSWLFGNPFRLIKLSFLRYLHC